MVSFEVHSLPATTTVSEVGVIWEWGSHFLGTLVPFSCFSKCNCIGFIWS